MENVRVLNRPEDFKRLGLNSNVVEPWEHGRRRDPETPPAMENWYFDSIMDDGTKAVVVFMTKTGDKRNLPVDSPNLRIQLTAPDGRSFEDAFFPPVEECETRKGECYVKYGPHSFIGDLVDCDISVSPVNGIGCELHLHGLTKPFRPGTGYIAFGDDEAKEYTWLTFPRCEVTGTLIYDGKTHEVHGTGYHDHQFHNTDSMSIIHHWFWGRGSLGDYTTAIFDIVATEKYGFKQIPIFCVMDKTGEVIFDGTEHGECKIRELYWSEPAKKYFPKIIEFIYEAVQSMSGTGRCYDNARMESFFATLKKEKLYQIHTGTMPMAQVKSVVFRYIMTYYNRERIYTANPGGLAPAMYRQAARGLAA